MRKLILLLLLLVSIDVYPAATLLYTFNAEDGTVGQAPPNPPLSSVTGPNIPIIANTPVYSGSKSYDVVLDRSQPNGWNPYRTEMRGKTNIQFQFERSYWIGFAFRRTIWDTDTSSENFPLQIHETPSSWTNWGVGTCQQSAASSAPIVMISANNTMTVKNLTTSIWSKPVDLNTWHTVIFHVKWSKSTTGYVESWYDGVAQARKPASGTTTTHRADSAMDAYCGPDTTVKGDVTFVPPIFAAGIYKWDWKVGRADTLTTLRRGTIDAIKIAEDVAGTDDAGGFALVNPAGTPPDTTPPTISSITESLLTTNGITITSVANEASNVRVDYGPTSAYGSNESSSTFSTSQVTALTGLTASTLYNYKVTRCDAAGNCTSSANRTFTTSASTSAYSNIVVSNLTATGYTVTWTTSVPRTSVVNHGTTTAYELTPVTDGTSVTNHSLSVSGLTPSTVYNFKLGGLDGSSANAESGNQTIRTLHSITSLSAIDITTEGFVCVATTSELTTRTCNYGTTSAYGSSRTRSGTGDVAQEVRLDPTVGITLLPSTLYHWQFCGTNSLGVTACSADQTVTTANPQPVISNIVISKTDTTITLTWDTNVAANTIVKYGKRFGYWTTQTDATLVTTGHSATLTGLDRNSSYAVVLRSENSTGAAGESTVLFIRTKKLSGMVDSPFSWLDEFLEAA